MRVLRRAECGRIPGVFVWLCGMLLAGAAAHAAGSPWSVIVAGSQTEAERLATVDLQRFLGEVTGTVPQIEDAATWRAAPAPAVVIGSAGSNPVLAGLEVAKADMGSQGYVLANATVGNTAVVVAAGGTGEGAVNAMYGLLRELGYGFFLGSESAPGKLPGRLPGDGPIARQPAFTIRGVLPWYNFFDSPTTWDPIDHRALIDQLVRSGANFVGFHTYDGEPFAAYGENGQMKWGGRLVNTQSPTWGTHPMPAEAFAYGTGKLYADAYFGARSTESGDDPSAAVRKEQDIMRDALDYARHRGVHTCIGFEVSGDPTGAAAREVVVKRLNWLLDEYPSLDYLWIWQREAQGDTGYVGPSTDALREYSAYRRDVFHRVVDTRAGARPLFHDTPEGKEARALEGVRLEQYAELAHRVLARRKEGPRLVVSGWGGDERLLSAEYYDGLDKLLPKDVVFSSLEHILPRPRVDSIYGELPPERQRWPIPWLEHDGDQWQPQPAVHVFEGLANDAWKDGCQGILAIHWRTRDVEENFAYLMDFAWQPGLTAGEFYRQLARRSYPPEIANEMAGILSALDSLGYRWVGGEGQTECGVFGFGPGRVENAVRLKALQAQAEALLPRAGASAARLKWLVAEMEWALEYWRAESAAAAAQKLLDEGNPAEALAALDAGRLDEALRTYATRITTRGEYGVLATINTKAVVAWEELRDRCLEALGKAKQPLTAPEWNPAPEILLPRLVASTPAGQDLDLMPIALGGKPAWLHYRAIGARDWKTVPVAEVKGWVRKAVVPAADLREPGVEIAFSFDASPASKPAWGPASVTVMPETVVNTRPFAAMLPKGPAKFGVRCENTGRFPFVLEWDDLRDADFYKVYRDGAPLGETCTAYFPDAPTTPAAEHQYRVEAWGDGRELARAEIVAASPDVTVADAIAPKVRWKKEGAVVWWRPSVSAQIACYRVLRAMPGRPGKFEEVADVPAARTGVNSTEVPKIDGTSTCRIIPVNQAGKEMPPADLALTWPNNEAAEVVESDLLGSAKRIGKVKVQDGAATFDGSGYLLCPHETIMNFESGAALSFEFRADSVADMPVLLSHGELGVDGWFAQILGGRFMIRTIGGDIAGPMIDAGKWHTVRWEYDGAKSDLAIDGTDVAPGQRLAMAPVDRLLVIGNYAEPGEAYAFHGVIRNLKFDGWLQKADYTVAFEFGGQSPWYRRDGTVKLSTAREDGRPTLRAEIGGHGDSQYNSAFIREEPVDPRLAPVLHFRMRTSTCGQLAILFQETNGDEQAYDAIDLVGRDDAYHSLADLGGMRLNDGQWHEVSLDLAKLLQSQRGAGDPPRIKNLMIGSWQNPAEPILVEFQDFWLGPRRAN